MALDNASALITGGLGQVGIAIIEHLQTFHPSTLISVIDLKSPSPSSHQYFPNVTYHSGSINDQVFISSLLSSIQPTIIFHTAGLIPSVAQELGLDHEEGFMKVNRDGTRILVEEAKKVGLVKGFVFTSSADVVKGDSWVDLRGVDEELEIPESFDGFYAKSKAAAETIVLQASTEHFRTVAIRTHGVFSAYDTNILPLLISAPRSIHLGPGTNLYDFTYAPNLAQAHILAATNLLSFHTSSPSSVAGQAFFVTNAEPIPFREFVSKIWEEYDGEKSRRGVTVPVGLAKVLVWIGEKIALLRGEKPLLTIKTLGDSVSERWFDNGKAREFLGYVPVVGLSEGVKRAVGG